MDYCLLSGEEITLKLQHLWEAGFSVYQLVSWKDAQGFIRLSDGNDSVDSPLPISNGMEWE